MKSQLHSYLITLGHICTDICQGALPALLPFLYATFGLSYASAAALVMCSSIVSSVIQPLFGWLGDRVDRPWFMSLGIILATSGIAAIGFVDQYWMMLVAASVSGTGVALFHPEGGKLANIVAGSEKGKGVANFSVGGNIGFAIGPVLASFALLTFGIRGTTIFLIPGVIMALILLSQTKAYKDFGRQEIARKKSVGEAGLRDDWPGFIKITVVNFLRSIIGTSMIVFLPLYWVAVFHQSGDFSPLMITLYNVPGAVATFFGGRIADKIGFKKIIVISYCACVPLLIAFALCPNMILAGILVVLIALSLSIAYSPVVALGQSYLPNRIGLASGISLGVVVSVGGAASPLVGLAGDNYGLSASMALICGIAIIGAALSFLVWRHKGLSLES